MAIYSDDPAVVAKSSKPYLSKKLERSATSSGQAAVIKDLNKKVASMELIGSDLWESLLDMEADRNALSDQIDKLEDGDNLIEQVNVYADLIEQFQTLVDQDRDGIHASAKELGVVVKGNSADRDVLSACFKTMCENMIGASLEED